MEIGNLIPRRSIVTTAGRSRRSTRQSDLWIADDREYLQCCLSRNVFKTAPYFRRWFNVRSCNALEGMAVFCAQSCRLRLRNSNTLRRLSSLREQGGCATRKTTSFRRESVQGRSCPPPPSSAKTITQNRAINPDTALPYQPLVVLTQL